jgi:Right handed beta helix region
MSRPHAMARLCAISLLAATCVAGPSLVTSGDQTKAQTTAQTSEQIKPTAQRSKAQSKLQTGVDSVLRAEKFKGMDAGDKIMQCLASLPQTGGVCDARNLTGEQQSANGFTVGSGNKPVQLILGPVTLVVAKTIFVQARSSITGMPSASGIAGYQGATVIKARDNAGANLAAVVQVEGTHAVLQDVTIDGNKAKNSGQGIGLLVNRQGRADLTRVTVQNAPGDGIVFVSGSKQESCCAKLINVMAIENGQSGLHIENSNDLFISMSEFENNGASGVDLDGSSGIRIEHSDFGGNHGDGLSLHGTPDIPANHGIFVGNQFGNNYRADVSIAGTNGGQASVGHMISSNEFLSGIYRNGGKYDAIHIVDSGYNVIAGNSFFAGPGHEFSSCVNISGKREKADNVSNNICLGTGSGNKNSFIGTSSTTFNGNQGETRQ